MICVTNRHLVEGDYFEQIKKVIKAQPGAIVLREKDLSEQAYEQLAKQVIPLCKQGNVPLVLHYYTNVAICLKHPALQVPFKVLQKMTEDEKAMFSELGCAIHAVEEAREAQALGATYLVAGHIYETQCKNGLPGRGISFLQEVCRAVSIPVYAIGGITTANLPECIKAGAKDGMMMSGYMR